MRSFTSLNSVNYPKHRVGSFVHILKTHQIYDSVCRDYWSRERFQVVEIVPHPQVLFMYKLKDAEGKLLLTRVFYEFQLSPARE